MSGSGNCKRVACLRTAYVIILLYCIGSLFTTTFFQGSTSFLHPVISTSNLKSSRTKSLPVIVRPGDGLGNQLFQYSVSYSIARRRNSDLYICLHENDFAIVNRKKNFNPQRLPNPFDRSYVLDVFNIPHDNVLIIPRGQQHCPLYKLPGKINKNNFSIFTDRDLIIGQINKNHAIQFEGYAESEMFFSDYKSELMELFTLKDNSLLYFQSQKLNSIMKEINETESVAVHVRRGDFRKYKRTIPLSYYPRAMTLMKEQIQFKVNQVPKNLTFYIFSDEIQYVEKDFREIFKNENYSMVFCSNNSRIVDFYLMTKCKHIIIANSTFSWWAAYLNRYADKIVIAPLPKFNSRWYYKISKIYKNIFGAEWNYPAQWITINPFI